MSNVYRFVLILAVLAVGTSTLRPAQPPAGQSCSLPPDLVSFQVVSTYYSVTPVALNGIPPGYALQNGIHEGWCVQYETLIAPWVTYHAGLYHTLAPLPPQLRNIPWDQINYLLNHKKGSIWDVQDAIWHLLGQALNPPSTTPMVQMIQEARTHGPGFIPQDGQLVAVVLEPQQGVQRLIIETTYQARCLDTTPPQTQILTPAFGLQFTNTQTILINAEATDAFGVTEVRFYNGQTLLGTSTSSPFTLPWAVTANDNGWRTLTTMAIDPAGNAGLSQMVAVLVNISPAPGRLSCTTISPTVCRIQFAGTPGRAYRVQCSPDLITWIPLDLATEISPGNYSLDHPQPNPMPQAFYQAILE